MTLSIKPDSWTGFHLFGVYFLCEIDPAFAMAAFVLWELADEFVHHLSDWSFYRNARITKYFDRRGLSVYDLLCGLVAVVLFQFIHQQPILWGVFKG
jgi:hypothetical protein